MAADRTPRIRSEGALRRLKARKGVTPTVLAAVLEEAWLHERRRVAIRDRWVRDADVRADWNEENLEQEYSRRKAAERELEIQRAWLKRSEQHLADMRQMIATAQKALADNERLQTQLDEAVRQLRALRGDHGP